MGTVTSKVVNANGVAMVDLGDLPSFGPSTRLPMADNDPMRNTYSLFIPGFVPTATPTDFLEIAGSASRIIRIRSIVATGTATAATNILLNTIRRSALAVGGTPTVLTPIPRDQNDAAATATVRSFGANPTVGTLIGAADGGRLNIAPAANGSIDRMAFQYGWMNDKSPILRGPTDTLCLSLATAASGFTTGVAWPAGGVLDINIVFSEDSNASN